VELPRAEFDGYVRRQESERVEEAARSLRMEASIEALEHRMNSHDLAHAASMGEYKGIRRALAWGFSLVGLLITAFGGTALYIVFFK
jgi:hypothetical protein